MKVRHLIFAFMYAAICLANLLAMPTQESFLGALLYKGIVIGCAAGSAYNLHLYITKAK